MTAGVAKTGAERAKAAQWKGAQFERDVANVCRTYWSDARRSRDNGSRSTSDTGDVVGTGDLLFWSCKNHEKAVTTPTVLILGWLNEATDKASGGTARARVPVLVLKRKGARHASRAWAYVWSHTLVDLHIVAAVLARPGHGITPPPSLPVPPFPVRMELGELLTLLAAAGYTERVPEVAW